MPRMVISGSELIRLARLANARAGAPLLLVAIVALAVWLRLRHAAGSMAYDEMASMYFSGQPWAHLWGWWMLRETNPPMFYSVLKLWRSVVPMGHWAMRALPLAVAFATLAVFGRFVRRRLGWAAALLGLLLCAVSSSDIYQADYLRGYGLARLAVLVSFIGLVDALEEGRLRGWLVYVAGAVVAIHCHTTMVLWPVIATLATLAEAGLRRDWRWRPMASLVLADMVTCALSTWVLVMTYAQLKSHAAANITWLEPLGWADFWATCNLQLLTGGTVGAALMGALIVVGAWRGRRILIVRLAIGVAIGTLVLFKASDRLHPIVSDFTLHWCFSFTVLIAAAALAKTGDGELSSPSPSGEGLGWGPSPRAEQSGEAPPPTPPLKGRGEKSRTNTLRRAVTLTVLAAVTVSGLVDLLVVEEPWQPQDWRKAVTTVAARHDAALLASHESIGVVIEQACLVELGSALCPFRLVVMADPKPTDNWAFGGYHGPLVAAPMVRQALGRVQSVYAFGRYYYMPLQHLGINPAGLPTLYWDDGELVGPIAVHAFDPPAPGAPLRIPDPDAQYTGAPDPPDSD